MAVWGAFVCVNFTMLHRYKLFLTSHSFSPIINLLNFVFIDVINVLLQIQSILLCACYYNPLINPKYYLIYQENKGGFP